MWYVFRKKIIMKKSKKSADLPTSKKDEEKLKSDKTTLPLPDVGDIPGQEHVQAMPAGEMADTTISSADEEADELFANSEEVNEGNVTDAERDALRDAANETPGVVDDENLEATLLASLLFLHAVVFGFTAQTIGVVLFIFFSNGLIGVILLAARHIKIASASIGFLV